MGRIEVTKIADGLYGIPVGPVNTFLLDSPDGCALIDTGVSGSTSAILRALHALGKQPEDVRHIILTHAHPDHIGSLKISNRRHTDSLTVAHSRGKTFPSEWIGR